MTFVPASSPERRILDELAIDAAYEDQKLLEEFP